MEVKKCLYLLKYYSCSCSSTDRIEVCGTSDSSSILLESTNFHQLPPPQPPPPPPENPPENPEENPLDDLVGVAAVAKLFIEEFKLLTNK